MAGRAFLLCWRGSVHKALIRLLLVDDHECWRRLASTVLQKGLPESEVVGEASDGWRAIQLAQQLQPDLVVLDIGLPQLNGIEVARTIRDQSPNSKILFMTENRSADVAEAALSTGACGYVVKSDAGKELLLAVKGVLEGDRYVSASVAGKCSEHAYDLKTPVTPFLAEKKIRHEVAFYADDADFVNGLARFIETALKAEEAVVVIATEPHHTSLRQRLSAMGLNLPAEIRQGRCIALEVTSALASFMVNDSPDPVLFKKLAFHLIARVARGVNGQNRRVAVCGEGVNTLLAAGNVEAAIGLERMWNEIAQFCELRILCAYFRSAFPNKENTLNVERICAEHSAVIGRDSHERRIAI